MGYFGYFGQDPTTDPSLDPSGGSAPSLPTDPSSWMPSVPSGTPTPYPGSPYPSSPSGTLPSGTPYPSGTPSLPGSTQTLPGASGGLQPYPGTSTSTTLPGAPVTGGSLVALPLGQPWASAPAVKALAASPTNGALFTSPNGQRAAWIQLVLRQMIGSGYFEPGNTAAAEGAIAALAQAYGYFMQMQLAPSDPALAAGGQGLIAALQAGVMTDMLSDAYASVQYFQSTPTYQTLANAPRIRPISAQDIARAAAALQPAAATPAAASSNTMLYAGLLGAAGLAAYLAFA